MRTCVREYTGINFNTYDEKVSFIVFATTNQLNSLANIYKEIWVDGMYDVFPVNGEHVVDVGGFIGDSAIYFLQKGAKYVDIYEPGETSTFIPANLALNGYPPQRYHLHVAAVTGRNGVIKLNQNINCGETSFRDNGANGLFEMQSLSLSDIAVQDSILKFDTEGSEYDTFENADRDTIRKFKAIMMEFHGKGYMPITSLLEVCGFQIVDILVESKWEKETADFKSSGMLYAKRLD